MNWPPDYGKEAIRRNLLHKAFSSMPDSRAAFKQTYQNDPVAFIQDWCWTVDPRSAAKADKNPVVIKPFILYPKQQDAIDWLFGCIEDEVNGLAEKTRGAGATWLFCAASVHMWLFRDNASVGWGSRKQELVDRKSDPDSIFEKIRFTIDRLPSFVSPEGLVPSAHLTFMKCVNPANGSVIKGEAGDNIGRGGRTLVYFKDEAAYYERADKIEAALVETTNTQIDFSSVAGVGTIFHQTRIGGVSRVFIFDAGDVPWMTEKFLAKKKRELTAKGLGHKFEQEYMRDSSAAVEGIVIPGKWIRAAVDAHKKLGIEIAGKKMAALDPIDEGGDTHALAIRRGITLIGLEEWTEGDPDFATNETTRILTEKGYSEFVYDAIGVGSGVKSSMKHTRTQITAHPFKGSWTDYPTRDDFIDPDSADEAKALRNSDLFKNLKSQSWWEVRVRFERTYKAVEQGAEFDPRELISLDSTLPLLTRLISELSQPTRGLSSGLILINKKPDGVKSPNLADALVMAYSDHLSVKEKKGPMMAFSG